MSDFLFARPSILEGIGRNLDLFGVFGSYNDTDIEVADRVAFFTDIQALRSDAQVAMDSLNSELNGPKRK